MKRIYKILAGTAGALTLAAAASLAVAHGSGNGAGYGPMGMMHSGMGSGVGGMGMGMGNGGMRGAGPGMMSEQALTQMKVQLAITAEQESAWQAFATKAADQAKLMQATHEQQWQSAGASTTMPERMTQRIGAMSQHLAGMQAVNSALSDLYTVLAPEQRSIADQFFGHMGQGGHGRGMRG